ncbi:hypothetical protein V8D89_008636, partial [Ganoderma adspersum]
TAGAGRLERRSGRVWGCLWVLGRVYGRSAAARDGIRKSRFGRGEHGGAQAGLGEWSGRRPRHAAASVSLNRT